MNRRTFLKKLGALAGLALVAPQALLAAPKPVIAEGVIIGTVKARFNSTDYGVIAIDSTAKKRWAKDFLREAKANSHFHKMVY